MTFGAQVSDEVCTGFGGYFLVSLYERTGSCCCHSDMSIRWMDGWMDVLRFYVLFNNISVIAGQLADDNERLCAMEPC